MRPGTYLNLCRNDNIVTAVNCLECSELVKPRRIYALFLPRGNKRGGEPIRPGTILSRARGKKTVINELTVVSASANDVKKGLRVSAHPKPKAAPERAGGAPASSV